MYLRTRDQIVAWTADFRHRLLTVAERQHFHFLSEKPDGQAYHSIGNASGPWTQEVPDGRSLGYPSLTKLAADWVQAQAAFKSEITANYLVDGQGARPAIGSFEMELQVDPLNFPAAPGVYVFISTRLFFGSMELDNVHDLTIDLSSFMDNVVIAPFQYLALHTLGSGGAQIAVAALGRLASVAKPRIGLSWGFDMQGHFTRWKAGVAADLFLGADCFTVRDVNQARTVSALATHPELRRTSAGLRYVLPSCGWGGLVKKRAGSL
uniref:Uncharacterized protein n=1 Tax=Wifsystermes virus TaxID=2796640 RepID=A0A7T7GUX8_9VIRU|nr:hypothetical protein [Wifsystermes virus]